MIEINSSTTHHPPQLYGQIQVLFPCQGPQVKWTRWCLCCILQLSQWKGPSLERSQLFHGNSRRRRGCVVISICMGRGQSVHSNEVSAQGPKLKQMQEEGRLVNLLNWSNGPSGIYEALYKVSHRSSSGQEEYVRRRVGMN